MGLMGLMGWYSYHTHDQESYQKYSTHNAIIIPVKIPGKGRRMKAYKLILVKADKNRNRLLENIRNDMHEIPGTFTAICERGI